MNSSVSTSPPARSPAVNWFARAGWAIPLLFTEAALQWKQATRNSRRRGGPA